MTATAAEVVKKSEKISGQQQLVCAPPPPSRVDQSVQLSGEFGWAGEGKPPKPDFGYSLTLLSRRITHSLSQPDLALVMVS